MDMFVEWIRLSNPPFSRKPIRSFYNNRIYGMILSL
nr:MAG TPA: hypothetical protein [Caudoviricetes sp.]